MFHGGDGASLAEVSLDVIFWHPGKAKVELLECFTLLLGKIREFHLDLLFKLFVLAGNKNVETAFEFVAKG